MKGIDLLEGLNGIDEKTISQCEASTRKKSFSKALLLSAACICCCAALIFAITLNKKDDNVRYTPKEYATDETSEATAPETKTTEKPLIWGDGKETAVENEYVYNEVTIRPTLHSIIEKSEDSDLIAFSAVIYTVYDSYYEQTKAMLDDLSKEQMYLENYLSNVAETFVEENVSLGMSEAEARARVYQDKTYKAVKEKVLYNYKKYQTALLRASYEKARLDFLDEYGFTRLYDVNDDKYIPYFSKSSSLAVFYGTKSQIMSFCQTNTTFVVFDAAEKDADRIQFSDYYCNDPFVLLDGEKMTEELKGAFEKEPTVKCRVHYADFYQYEEHEKWEWEEMACKEIGLSGMDELESRNDSELIDKFLYALDKLQKQGQGERLEEIAKRLFKEGELYDTYNYSSVFYANLTYERAAELTKSGDVAYIDLAERANQNDIQITSE